MTSYRVAADPAVPRRASRAAPAFSAAEWRRLAGLYGFVLFLHVLGWGLYLHYAQQHPALVGLGLVAYMFGLRHAFDADHIAAIDDTVRFMLQNGRKPLGVGFFFSLGHSTIVVALASAIVMAAAMVKQDMPELQRLGSVIGASVSGAFLLVIGVLNLLVLLDMLQVWRAARSGTHGHAHLDELVAQCGFINRVFGRRLRTLVNHSWQMYPLGILFGLGFDTASEIGVLSMTAGAASGSLPVAAVLALPILFAAGMSAMDTTDGVLMVKAYDWALVNPLRRIFYNLTITSLSVAVALFIGTVELAQVLIGVLQLHGSFVDAVAALDFGLVGYLIVGMFVVAYVTSLAIWRFGRMEERHAHRSVLHFHQHEHDGGARHAHRHFH